MLTAVLAAVLACPPTCGDSPACFGECWTGTEDMFTLLDWNGDCVLDVLDIAAFAADCFSGEACADFYCNGRTDADDLGDYITLFYRVAGREPSPCDRAPRGGGDK